MKRMMTISTLALVATLGALSPAAADGVRIGVNIGLPAPVVVGPPVVYGPPQPVYGPPQPVVVAPPAPVFVGGGVPIYYYGAQYYTFYNGGWFVGPRYGGPWRYVAYNHVPRAIIAAPRYHGRPAHGGPTPGHVWHGHGNGHRW